MLESKWGLRLIALALAVFFFLSANNVFGNMFNADKFSQKTTETLQDVPVEVKYNSNKLYASKVPETVDVEISGPQSQILKAENGQNIKVTLDLNSEKSGRHTTQFKVHGLNKDIDYDVKPKEATVNLEEKVTKNLKVEPDVSSNDVDADYKVSEQSVSPDTVKVTGGQDQIDKIAYLKATYKNNSKISKDTTDVAKITAFDRNLNKLDVSIQPEEVNLSAKVEPYSKKVKIKTKTTGSLANGKEIDDIELSDKEVEVFGNRKELEDVDEIKGEIDLDNISETTDKSVQLDVPDEVSKVEPNDTTAKVIVQ
ncbi:YbbR-like domain-containing protein [Staphylococcus arlettae]|uniref:CdaR family protein n=1 Tax=Staphylococcus arlettae TaxID=29378 RepID=UPI001E3A2702|nr:CdaR family protein [Staphylococcus arlettae]MCD8834588.1 YbbR-like domain-containing protein [Staphylococcus arlettae]